jgi:hypothetical protein
VRWFVALALLAAPVTVRAQAASVAEELRLNLHGGALNQGSSTVVGPGFSIGYGSSRWFVAFLTYHRATLPSDDGDFAQRHLDAGIRAHLRGSHARLVPVVIGAWTWRSANWDGRFFLGDTMDVKIAGSGPTLGAGALYYVIPRVAVEAAAHWTGGTMDQVTTNMGHFDAGEAGIEDDALRFEIGVTWFPIRVPEQRRR